MSERSQRLAALDAMAEQCIEEFEAGTQNQPGSRWQSMKSMPGYDDWVEVTRDRTNRQIEMYGIPNGICLPIRSEDEKAKIQALADALLKRINARRK